MTDPEFTPTPTTQRPAIDEASTTMTAQLLAQGGVLELQGAVYGLTEYAKMIGPKHVERPGIDKAARLIVERIAQVKRGL